MIARAVGGVSKANVSLATAVMADITDSATRAKAMVIEYFDLTAFRENGKLN